MSHNAFRYVGALGAIGVLLIRRGRAAGLFEPQLAVAAANRPVIMATVRSRAVGRARAAQLLSQQVHKVTAAVVHDVRSDGALGLDIGWHQPRPPDPDDFRCRAFVGVGTRGLAVVGCESRTRLQLLERCGRQPR